MPPNRQPLQIHTDAHEIKGLIGELLSNLEVLREVPELFVELGGLLSCAAEFVVAEVDFNAAAGAGEATMLIKPTKRFLEFMVAVRALDGWCEVVD